MRATETPACWHRHRQSAGALSLSWESFENAGGDAALAKSVSPKPRRMRTVRLSLSDLFLAARQPELDRSLLHQHAASRLHPPDASAARCGTWFRALPRWKR